MVGRPVYSTLPNPLKEKFKLAAQVFHGQVIALHSSGTAATSVSSWQGMLGAPLWVKRGDQLVIAGFNIGIPSLPSHYEVSCLVAHKHFGRAGWSPCSQVESNSKLFREIKDYSQ